MNFGKAGADSQSRSNTGFRGTQYENQAADESFSSGKQLTNLSNQLTSSPQAMMSFGRQMLPGGKYGLGENADQAVEQYGKFQFGNTSADMVNRGFASPESQNAVIGSAITNSLPFLIPQIQQFQQAQFMAPQSLIQTAKTSADYWNRALGAQSDASSNYSSFNFGVQSSPQGSSMIPAMTA